MSADGQAGGMADQFVEFNGGKVYFCCGGCAAEFAQDPDKFAAKANLQLVQTGQLKQIACPFSGKPTSPETALDVDGVNVSFCCDHCKSKAAEAANEEQVNLIFADASKGFKTVKSPSRLHFLGCWDFGILRPVSPLTQH